MELTARYGLEFNPFLKNSKEILFEGTEYTEAKFRLDYLAKTKGFGLLTGAPCLLYTSPSPRDCS